MLKYLTHKLRTQSIDEGIRKNHQKNHHHQHQHNRHVGGEKIDGHDSGTESDGEINQQDELRDHDMELSSASSRNATTTRTTTSSSSPTDTVGSTSAAESPVFLGAVDLAYDPHSSEEELEVINGATAVHQFTAGDSDVFDDSPRRSCSSTINVENRKRSLAQSSEDELRNYGEHCHTPVNFRTSPPLEALKPHRTGSGHLTHYHSQAHSNHLHYSYHNHHHHYNYHHQPHLHPNHRTSCTSPSAALQRSATPLILTESGRGLESIHISCESPTMIAKPVSNVGCDTAHPADEVRSISPPAKFFHCAVSPRRRPPKNSSHRLLHPRPHRPCLDFDKMQQVRDVAF